jgi:hypothetical protein
MAIKKALYGRQLGSIYFFSFVFIGSWMRVILFEYFLYPFYSKRVCFTMFTVAKIKCQVLPILDVKRLQYLFEDAEISRALFSALFFMFFCNSYGPVLFI